MLRILVYYQYKLMWVHLIAEIFRFNINLISVDHVYWFTNRAMYKEWLATYESLTQMVVPRSSQLVHEDAEYGLYTVSVFKKVIDEFKLHAREKK